MSISKAGIIVIALTLLLFSQTSMSADNAHPAKAHADNEIQLSHNLKNLLNKEMAAIEKGMMDLVPAISSGEWHTAATIAKNIKDSFILKQKLTEVQKEELHRVLPQVFIEMDQDFHKSAGMLAHAAEMKNADVVNFYFFKLNNACVTCHAKFAKDRFPGLGKSDEGDGGHH